MFKWGIISAASIASSFMEGIKTSRGSAVCAIASRSRSRAEEFARKYNIPKAYDSYADLLKDPEVEGVYICNLHPWHREAALMAARAGKHILVEKPAFMTAEEAVEVIGECRKAGVFIMEAFMYRCHPQTKAACDIISSGLLGEVHFTQTSFGFFCGGGPEHRVMNKKVGGGGILDVGCYNASLTRLLAGAALGKPFANPVRVRAAGVLGETGSDHIASAVLEFEGGIVSVMSCGIQTPMPNNAVVCGTRGQMTIETPWSGDGRIRVTGETPKELVFDNRKRNLYSYEIDCVAGQNAPWPAMSPEDTIGNMELLDAWRREIGLTYP